MAKRKTNTKTEAKKYYEEFKPYLVPSLIGGAIAWFFSGNTVLGIQVFVAVWIGTWIGKRLLGEKS